MKSQKEKGSNMDCYLFVHFVGEQNNQEQVFFSVSEDGLHWKDLNGGQAVLESNIGEKGVRDPFIIKDDNQEKYYLIATDLKMESKKDWKKAQYEGSKEIIVWESEDLVNWSEERAVKVGTDSVGCVWAPEAIYDSEREAFLLFFASMVKEAADPAPKQKIYATYTKDFTTVETTVKYIERENHIIDTNIIEHNGIYYRFSKDETTKTIMMERGLSLDKESFQKLDTPVLDQLYGLEGPECYQLPSGEWCLIADQFSKGLGYLPIIIPDLERPEMIVLNPSEYDMGETRKRHGGVIRISDEEYKRLVKNFA
ncbi:glycoside hydrolase family 43 protein [Marinilactibacillus sp. XAAS-LB27]|uniref:glycoside hydrolase family 43 protein n=1 Tax=Marinilactibacillus sp. XAAS-LB27 TaxID=3114538 RepID=UPI002E19FB88|nr:glycoside hydrolase family 43 protein [Marinilactibacillus sp. XAAS-LB27]